MWKWLLVVICLIIMGGTVGFYILRANPNQLSDLTSPLLAPSPSPTPLPLLEYTIPNLAQRQYQASTITVESVLDDQPTYTSYLFSYTTLGKKMSGQLNVPKRQGNSVTAPVIVMLRGYVPLEAFTTGVGTKNAAKVLAQNGYITIAPDFFGYGESDPEPEDSWQARFEKPITVIELIKTLEAQSIEIPITVQPTSAQQRTGDSNLLRPTTVMPNTLGMWGHSNGGQIALSTLEILAEPIPTTLWAPVTAPFPYSILFFSDESADEGKDLRKWLSIFEKDYDVFDFTLTQHLDRLRGPLQLHHGTADEAALKTWSDEFVGKLTTENKRRAQVLENIDDGTIPATEAATINQDLLNPISIDYFTYPGADHNLQPGWDTVVSRDLEFFKAQLPIPTNPSELIAE